MDDDAKIPPADPKETAVALKGLAPSVDEGSLTTTVGAHGKLLRVKLDGLGGAHVVFSSTRAAQRAAAALNGAVVQGQRISAQHVRTFSKTTRPCRGFLAGKCRKGDQCKYWHGADPSATTATAPPAIGTTKVSAKKVTPVAAVAMTNDNNGDDISGIPKASICRNFAKGACVHADKCRFAHVLGAGTLPPPPRASIPAQCSFFLAGRCTKGDDCAFLHTDRAPQPPASKPTMCSYFAAGRCARGDQCAYLHETKPAATTPGAAAVVVQVTKPKQPAVTAKPAAKKAKAVVAVVAPVAMPSVNGDERACIECEKPGVATWVCAGCDNATYCDECKTLVHRPKVMRSHSQAPLPARPTRPVCGECETESASVECADCGVPYCATCDASVHQFKSLRGHTRLSVVEAPLEKKTKMETKKTTTVKAETPAVPKPVTAYIDSVPQYDLPSESDSSDDEEEEEEEEAPKQQQPRVRLAPVDDVSSESDDEDDQESPAAAAMRAATTAATGYVESVPKYELSSESESSEDEEDTADDDDSVEEVKQSIVNAAVVAVKQKILSPVKPTARAETPSLESSDSDSDDDDFEDERPAVAASSSQAKPAGKLPTTTAISSESESDSDDENTKPKLAAKANGKAPPTAPTPKRKASVSSESSSDSDSSDDKPPAKQQRVVAKVVPVKAAPVAARTAATRATLAPTKVGISTGSSHSLVKTIEAYAESDNSEVLHLDPNLNGFERLLAHDCAERLGLNHVSVGEGLERHITVSRKGGGAGNGKRCNAPAAAAANGSKKQKRA